MKVIVLGIFCLKGCSIVISMHSGRTMVMMAVGVAVGVVSVKAFSDGLFGVSASVVKNALAGTTFESDPAVIRASGLTVPKVSPENIEKIDDFVSDLANLEEGRAKTCRASLGIVQKALLQLADAKIDRFAFDSLARTAGYVFVYGGETKYPKAIAADRLSRSTYQFPTGVNGDALHYGHQMSGLIALREGKIEAAGEHLIRSVDTFSPVTSSFGPRMRLADELLGKQQFKAVENYLLRCKEGWSFAKEEGIDSWLTDVRSGRRPSNESWAGQMWRL